MDNKHILDKKKRTKPAIGVFVSLFESYQNTLWRGIAQVAAENDVNVIAFVGASIDDVTGFRKYWNTIYDLSSPVNLDGLIVFSAAIKTYVTEERLAEFIAPYRHLPMVSINQKLEDIATISNNSALGLANLFNHMIADHGYRRIGFIRGPKNFEDAEIRYETYKESLERHGIPFDPDLVTQGTFIADSGVEAIQILLDERNLTDLDAIVGANDAMTMGAWGELNRRNIDVPTDIALAGFDDIPDAGYFAIPLTTVSTTLVDQGRQSAQMLIDYIKTGKPLKDVSIDTQLVIRESCGCASFSLTKSNPEINMTVGDAKTMTLDQQQELAIADIRNITNSYFPNLDSESIPTITKTFFEVFQGKTGKEFLTTLKYVLRKSSATLSRNEIREGVISNWHEILPILRERTLPFLKPEKANEIDEILYQAQIIISTTADQAHFNLGNWAEAELRIQSEMIRDLNTAGNVNKIADILAYYLPKLDINTSALALYDKGDIPSEYSQLVMLCHNGKRMTLNPDGHHFLSKQLVPYEVVSPDQLPFLSIHPLIAGDMHFGFLLLEMKLGDWSLYNTHLALSEQIGAALYSVLLQDQVKRNNERLQKRSAELALANEQLEKARKEAEQANEVKSWFLASMSHELRTPLNGIVNFTRFVADGMLGEINEKQKNSLQKAVSSSKHLLSLINDVLDISKIESGSLKLLVENNVDLVPELTEIAATGEALLEGKTVELILDIEDDLPTIRADRRRVKQIVLNILSNACKFTDEGYIEIRAIQDEENVLISIKDTGPGIAKAEQNAVFETFKQTETGIVKGGGTGLGMPISQRLTQAHGGKLWLESDTGKGATFFVRLPIESDSLQPTLKERLK